MKRLVCLALVACKSHEAPPPPAPPPPSPKLVDQVGFVFSAHLVGTSMDTGVSALEAAGGQLRPEEAGHQMYEAVMLDSDFGPLRVNLRGNATVTGVDAQLRLHGSADALFTALDQAWGTGHVIEGVHLYTVRGVPLDVKPEDGEVQFSQAR